MRFYDLFEFCTAPVSSLVADGVVAGVRLSTNTDEPVGLKLADCLRTFCPKAKYLYFLKNMSSIKFN